MSEEAELIRRPQGGAEARDEFALIYLTVIADDLEAEAAALDGADRDDK